MPSVENNSIHNIIYDNVQIGDDVGIGLFNVIGAYHDRLAVKYAPAPTRGSGIRATVSIGHRTTICNHTVIYEGAIIGTDCFIDDYVRLGAKSTVNEGSMLLYGARIYDNVSIGANCRIAGFIPGRTVIGNGVTMMGMIAHKYDRPLDWFRDEPSPIIEDDVVVGLGALIVGGIRIGRGSYVAANATLTKSVPPNSMVLNANEVETIEEFESRKHHMSIQ
jgi:acetyltransferase-like isoleucine patch superfamily enzyme